MANASALQEQLDLLRASYAARLGDRLGHIDETWAGLLKNAWDGDAFEELHRAVHSLAGSGGTFGFPILGDAARTIEVFIKSILHDARIPTSPQRSQISILLDELKNAADQASNADTARMDAAKLTAAPLEPLTHREKNRMVFLVESDDAVMQTLAGQLRHFDYSVQCFARPDEMRKAVLQTPPAAIIAEAVAGADGLVGAPVLKVLQQDFQHEHEASLPVLFLAAQDDVTTRLQAVRAGGIAYFTKPVEFGRLLDRLEIVTANQAPDPFRILIVDDEPALCALYSFVLSRSGMLTRTVSNPAEIVQTLVDFQPDAILMDMQLSQCSGMELAVMIRQQEAFMSVPIVFLSSALNRRKPAFSLRLGGDDFLAKPIHPDHLTAAMTAGAQVSRTLRSCMSCDALTGLANHSSTKTQLSIEVARAHRQNTPLSFARIDIDDFKLLNDTHGYLVGDRVLKSLSHLLRQRLRRTDIIGRYGNDEFGVILGGADHVTALKVLEDISAGFARIQHHAAAAGFAASFSCGVAVLPPCESASTLSDAADKALMQAKAAGHGRVVIVTEC